MLAYRSYSVLITTGLVAKWANEGGVSSHMETNHRWGCVALGCMDILFLFSLSGVRQMYYHLFYVTHSIAAVVLLVAVSPP